MPIYPKIVCENAVIKYFDAGPLHTNPTNILLCFLMLEVSFLKYKMKNEKLQEKIFPKWKKNLKNKRNKRAKQEDYGFYFAQ